MYKGAAAHAELHESVPFITFSGMAVIPFVLRTPISSFRAEREILAIGPPFGSARNNWMLPAVPPFPSEIAA